MYFGQNARDLGVCLGMHRSTTTCCWGREVHRCVARLRRRIDASRARRARTKNPYAQDTFECGVMVMVMM